MKPSSARVRRPLLLAGLCLLMFAMLAVCVAAGIALPFDLPLLHWAEQQHTPWWDRCFLFFAAAGYGWGVVPASVLLVLWLAWRRRWQEAGFAALALAGSGLLNMALKRLFSRARPDVWPSIAPEPTWSFPSGHAMGSMALAAVLVLLVWPTRMRWPVIAAMLIFVPMVGASRVYLGVHYPSDILAGWAAALAWVIGSYWLISGRSR